MREGRGREKEGVGDGNRTYKAAAPEIRKSGLRTLKFLLYTHTHTTSLGHSLKPEIPAGGWAVGGGFGSTTENKLKCP